MVAARYLEISLFLISNFRRVLHIACILLGITQKNTHKPVYCLYIPRFVAVSRPQIYLPFF
jgi:hypothetical protein